MATDADRILDSIHRMHTAFAIAGMKAPAKVHLASREEGERLMYALRPVLMLNSDWPVLSGITLHGIRFEWPNE